MIVRPTIAADIPRLQAIERAAAELFRGLDLIDLDAAGHAPEDDHRAAIAAGLSFTACDETLAVPIGFVIGDLHLPDAYLHELDVHPDHHRRGVGKALVEAFCTAAAAAQGARSVALSTFKDVPWNAPLYRRLGFADIPHTDYLPWMHAIEAGQAAFLDLSTRTFMRRTL